MFWPQDYIFNCFKQLMLFSWFGSVISLIVYMYNQQHLEDNNMNCSNQTDFQLLNNIMCERSRFREFQTGKEQCYLNGLNFILNFLIVVSMLIDWIRIKFLKKWFSFGYLLNLIYLLAFHCWAYLNELDFNFTTYYLVYLGLIGFQCFISLIFEYNYYNRYLTYDYNLEDPMFDSKIISYSSVKIVYMVAYLINHQYPQNKWTVFSYQLYKHLLICISQLSIMMLIWYFISLDCDHLVYGERLILILSCILFLTLIIIWKLDTKSAKLIYILLSSLFSILLLNLFRKLLSSDQLYNLSIYLIVMIMVMLTSILALKFSRSFKGHRAYSDLFEDKFNKLLMEVYEQCRRKEYFMIRLNYKIKHKCCLCSNLAIDLICNQCNVAVFNPKK